MKNCSFINKPIVIFRGDDTSAFNLRSIKIILKGDLDLSNAIAKFTLLDYHKEWNIQEVASGELTMSFASADTKAMPLGEQTGTFRLYDMSTGKPRQLTVVNKIPFLVTNRVCELDDESYHADVSVASGEIISIEFNVGVGAVNGKADKVKNAVNGDLAGLDANGNLTDSGIPASDVLRKSQMDPTPTAGSLNPVTSGGIKQAIDAATPSDYEQVKAQVEQNTTDIDNIEAKIPSQASAQNQLADKAFVNSSIATNTATFRGTYNLVSDLDLSVAHKDSYSTVGAALKTYLDSQSVTQENNDYCFIQIPTADATPTEIARIDRYKCSKTESGGTTTIVWQYEYSLNNSGFTAAQWAAINSGITSGLVEKLNGIEAGAQVNVVTGVKGNAEQDYRTGNINLTPANIGALSLTGGMMSGNLQLEGNNIEIIIGDGGIDDQYARLSLGELQVSNGESLGLKLAHYSYDKIQVTANGSTNTLTLPLATDTLALLSDIPSVSGLAPLASPTFTGSLTVGTRRSGETVGVNSVAEGDSNTASGECSHSEGSVSIASGRYSHAENIGSVASGNCSHAEGGFTTAQNSGEHSQGAFNDSHKASTTFGSAGNTLSSIGFGSNEDDRKNAVETMQDGKTFIYGLGGYDGTNPTGSGIKDLATAVGEKAPLASPAFTGTPTAPTPTAGDNSTKVATTEFVQGAVGAIKTFQHDAGGYYIEVEA